MPANDKRPVKVNRRSGFDKHYRNTLTGNCGTLIPILVDEIIPDTKVNLKINLAAALPPLVSDTYMNVRLRVEAFAVPHRLCYGNFEDFFCDYPVDILAHFDDTDVPPLSSKEYEGCVPLLKLSYGSTANPGDGDRAAYCADYFGVGGLLDYMGYNLPTTVRPTTQNTLINVMPLVAYNLIWQEWYRNPRVQKSAFMPKEYLLQDTSNPDITSEPSSEPVNGLKIVASLPFARCYFDSNNNNYIIDGAGYNDIDAEDYFFKGCYMTADGKSIFDLRQRNFGLDYFTAAMVEPQQGPQAKVAITSEGGVDSFTISSLRAQNSIQQFRERNNLTSPRYQQQNFARYGVAPSDGVIQRPVLLGAATYDVYSHGVTQSANGPDEPLTANTNKFFGLLGARGGNGFASGSDFIIRGFHAKEPMYIIVLASLVPDVSYSQNMNPIWKRYIGKGSISDMANGILQNVGPQPITERELICGSDSDNVFAYTDRYSDWMFKPNEIHGHFKPNSDLHNFVLQREFDIANPPEFGSEFLEIPTSYLDDVLQVSSATMGFSYWMDCLLEYSVSMPLQEYAIPSLQDPGYEHGKTIVLRKNGQLL